MVGRRRDFDLARAGGVSIGSDHPRRAGNATVEERPLLWLGESPALLEQGPDRLLIPVHGIHPRQVKPSLKVADLIRRERRLTRSTGSALRRAAPCLELAIPRVRLKHPHGVHAEEVPYQEALLFRRE